MKNSKRSPNEYSLPNRRARTRKVVLVDNYDSFTYNLVQALAACGACCEVFQNDAITVEEILRCDPDGVVLCPGPASPDEAGITLELVETIAGRLPALGVCLGHQAIGQCFGARVRSARRLMHGKTSPIVHHGTGLFRGLPSPFEAARYHSLVVDGTTLPTCLESIAWTPEGELMGIRLRGAPVFGVQFHPESILSENGRKLLVNWLEVL